MSFFVLLWLTSAAGLWLSRRQLQQLAPLAALGVVIAAGLAVRAFLLWDPGFTYDIGTYKAWALKLSNPEAPFRLYEEGYFADYPPLYMYVLAAIGGLARLLGIDGSAHFTALIKTPALIADLTITWLLWRAQIRGQLSTILPAWALAAAYWLNPAVLFDSALWGQTESILALFALLALLYWQAGRVIAASALLGLALAFKPQAAVFVIIFGVAVLRSRPWQETVKVGLAGAGAFAAAVAPFALQQPADWIIQLYLDTASTYDYITVNAYNLWALLGLNWQKDVGSLLGLGLQQWATLLILGLLAALGWRLGRELRGAETQHGTAIAWAFALGTVAFFLVAPRMHERYILPALPFLLLLGQHRLILALLAGWSLVALANMAAVFHFYVTLDEVPPGDTAWIRLISAAATLLGVISIAAWRQARWPGALAQLGHRGWSAIPSLPQAPGQAERWQWTRHGVIIMAATALALILGLLRLGATDYPQRGLVIDTLDLRYQFATPVRPHTALIYTGEGKGRIKIDARIDGRWHPALPELALDDFFKLHEAALDLPAATQSLRVHLSGDALRINELGLLDVHGNALTPSALIPAPTRSSQDAPIDHLVDEPGTWQPGRGYMASPYFDEIYHARTAYEYLHGLSIYETTHPPLGKWLISLGIEQFGMTPFGMRFAGLVASALIVGALGWGGWLLVGRASGILLASGLGLFEFSRFSIGRYATIDSFLILFLLLSALLLWRAFGQRQDWTKGWQPRPSLLLTGLFLGCAIATKWSALYFGMGVFGFFLICLARETLAPAPSTGGQPRLQRAARLMPGAALGFGLIPLGVYLLSYIPFLHCLPHQPELLSVEGLKQIWKSQVDMFDYHARLDSTHPFSAAFYTWPVLAKPLWLFIAEQKQPLRSSITLLGNPLVWWGGLVLLIALVTRKLRLAGRESLWLLGCIAALYLPWTAVSRISFIYHYYPVVPFLILLVTVTLCRWPDRRGQHIRRATLGISGILFAAFYPAISGFPVPTGWTEALRWLPGWWML